MCTLKKVLLTIGVILLLVLILSGKALPIVFGAILILVCGSWLIIPIALIYCAGAFIWSLWK